MRVFSVLYYTTDEEAYSVFIKSSERALNEAANRGTEVKLLPSFEKDGDQYVPLFGTISYLAQYLEQYQRYRKTRRFRCPDRRNRRPA